MNHDSSDEKETMVGILRGIGPATVLVAPRRGALEHFGKYLTHSDLSIDHTTLHNVTMGTPDGKGWPEQITFWGQMLGHLTTLTSLRLHDARERFESVEEDNLDLNMIFNFVEMNTVEKLELTNWAVTEEILTMKLMWAFPGLRFLDLELLDLRSDEDNLWVKVLRRIKSYYGDIGFDPLVGLRQRQSNGKAQAYVKATMKRQKLTQEQLFDVWNKVAEGSEED